MKGKERFKAAVHKLRKEDGEPQHEISNCTSSSSLAFGHAPPPSPPAARIGSRQGADAGNIPPRQSLNGAGPTSRSAKSWTCVINDLVKVVTKRLGTRATNNPDERQPGEIEKRLYSSKYDGLDDILLEVEGNRKPDRYIIRFEHDAAGLVLACALLLSVTMTSVVSPLTYVFGGTLNNPQDMPGDGATLVYVDIIVDTVYAICLLTLLRTSYLDQTNMRKREIVESRKILRHYLSSPLYCLQVLSLIPYPWMLIDPDSSLILNALKITRISHFRWPPDALSQIIPQSGKDPVMNSIRRVAVLYLVIHWTGCFLSYYGGFRAALLRNGADAYETEGVQVGGKLHLYMLACTEGASMWIGALDNPFGIESFREHNFIAMLLVMLSGPLGLVVVAFLCAHVCHSVHLMNALDMRQEEKQANVERALTILNVPPDLKRRVYKLHQFQRLYHDSEALGVLFSSGTLSAPLDCALKVYLYSESVLGSKFFSGGAVEYVVAVVHALRDEIFVPGDYLVRRGELAWEMYFVSTGNVSIFAAPCAGKGLNDAVKVAEKGPGDYFGEIALLHACVRSAWVRADKYVIAALLARKQMEPIWKMFPEERRCVVAHVHATISDYTTNAKALNQSSQTQFQRKRSMRSSQLMEASEQLMEVERFCEIALDMQRRGLAQLDELDSRHADLERLVSNALTAGSRPGELNEHLRTTGETRRGRWRSHPIPEDCLEPSEIAVSEPLPRHRCFRPAVGHTWAPRGPECVATE